MSLRLSSRKVKQSFIKTIFFKLNKATSFMEEIQIDIDSN